MKAIAIRAVAVLATLVALFPLAVQAAENPAFWKHQVKGEFATVLANLKASLEAKQFLITGEENLAYRSATRRGRAIAIAAERG